MPEAVDLVDSKDRKIGIITKEEAHEKGLRHRAVHVLVFNNSGKLFLQKRAKNKLLFPDAWDSSTAEHVQKGETYRQAALRGLKEELGIENARVKFLFKDFKQWKTKTYNNKEFIAVFESKFDGKVKLSKESSAGKWLKISKVKKFLKEKPEIICPFFLKFIKKLIRMKKL